MSKTDLQNFSDEQLVHHELGLERTLFGHTLRHRLNQLDSLRAACGRANVRCACSVCVHVLLWCAARLLRQCT